MKVINTIDSFRSASASGSWFYRIVANAALEKARRRHGGRIDISLDDVLEIANAGHVTVGGVKTRVHRARLFIRKRLVDSLESSSVEPLVESPEQ